MSGVGRLRHEDGFAQERDKKRADDVEIHGSVPLFVVRAAQSRGGRRDVREAGKDDIFREFEI